jgi:aminocarboxymuconate-semialdehyde decarboxylase
MATVLAAASRAVPGHVVDVHAHYFGPGLDTVGLPSDPRWPRLVEDSPVRGRILLGDEVFREVRSPLWNGEHRVAELDAAGIAVQVLSPVPVMLATWADEGPARSYASATNDSLAAAVSEYPDRLQALGTVPLPHVDAAVQELDRAVSELGLRGVQIGTQFAGRDLDDSLLRPFFEAAEALGAAIFIHPTDGGGGVVRRPGQPYDFGLGMPTDTAIAATALVFGGVLERFPRLRVGLAHGCGTFPLAYPRLRLGASIWRSAEDVDLDDAVRRLWVDSLVLDPELLGLLVHRFGADRVMVGTDHPFVPGQLEGAAAFVEAAASSGAIDREQVRPILASNGLAFLGLALEAAEALT